MGPLAGVRIVEFTGIGPAPYCAMVLADLGATVIRLDRKTSEGADNHFNILHRSRPSLALDLKTDEGHRLAVRLIRQADALIEGFRPGVMERLRLGPEDCLAENPRLVYGRVTGWGQTGPLKHAAGHDINYIALSGTLHAIGPRDGRPLPPLNLVGDFGGGGMLLALGIVCALLEARSSGKGQTIDAAMTEGAASLMSMIYGLRASGEWKNQRGANLLDGGSHFYRTYECADQKFIAIGALESKFYDLLLEKLGMTINKTQSASDREGAFESLFKSRSRDEWCRLLEGTDACFAPVLDMNEAPSHAHNVARRSFVTVSGVHQPAPSPRFSRTQPADPTPPRSTGQDGQEALFAWGFSPDEVKALVEGGTI